MLTPIEAESLLQLVTPAVVALTVSIFMMTAYYFFSWRMFVQRQAVFTNMFNQSKVIDEVEGIHASSFDYNPRAYTDISTVYDIFLHGLSVYAYGPCFGSRSSKSDAYTWQSYSKVNDRILSVMSAMLRLHNEGRLGDGIIGIYSRNTAEWVITEYACAASSLIVVPIYNTLGDEACFHILKQTKMRLVFCETGKHFEKLMNLGQAEINYAVIFKPSEEDQRLKDKYAEQVCIKTFAEFEHSGEIDRFPVPVTDPNSVFMICYTSGTTGTPKGVLITHAQHKKAITVCLDLKLIHNTLHSSIRHLSFLPLAHIMEQLFLGCVLYLGGCAAFLTTDLSGLMADVQEIRPTCFAFAPRILSRIYEGYMKTMRRNPVFYKLLQYVLKCRKSEQQAGIYRHDTFWDWLFFRTLRKEWGGEATVIVCGGAPLRAAVRDFIESAFAFPIVEGYGSTEIAGVLSFTLPGDPTGEVAGALLPGVQVKLLDVPDMDLVAARDGKGEIGVRGSLCTRGYYMEPEKTKELFIDGWLRMGDIGIWTEKGALKIVDRCKNIFKLSQGEYIAPTKLEDVYQECSLVTQVFVDGNSLYSFLVGIVVPSFSELIYVLSKEGSDNCPATYANMTPKELCVLPAANEVVLREMNQFGRDKGLKGFEIVKKIHLCPYHFTTENQLLTPTMKVARPKLRRHFEDILENLYKQYSGS